MNVLVLGSAAGGGFPQWNCNCPQCAGQRSGRLHARVRTQSSLALSANGRDWILLNASPDITEQIRAHPRLQPQGGLRHTPIRAVVLLDAQIGHVAGLLSLREGPPIDLYATPSVFEHLTTGLPLLPALQHYCGVRWHLVPVAGDQEAAAFGIEGFESLRFEAVAVPGKAPPYSPQRIHPAVGDNIALRVLDSRSGKRLFYAPGLARVGDAEIEWMSDADCVVVDGTFWSEDELIAGGLRNKRACDLGHLPQSSGPAGLPGMLEALSELHASRKVLIHVNNTNPILDESSPQHAELRRSGIEVAYDGMEIEL